MASLTLMYFAIKNERLLKAPELELYNLVKYVAKSNNKDRTIKKIKDFLKKYIQAL